ncbi:hypothetical protein [Streptomyces sp. NRRL F-5123]|uniref:hypothetical protein n=1 Tax=Streptomyces sp. NRRL F-5123 TaxID=1463856 RepID=UPI000A5D26EC|nr:hypothetical protein [Streptomyces sp. NRRL F-5123]
MLGFRVHLELASAFETYERSPALALPALRRALDWADSVLGRLDPLTQAMQATARRLGP